MKLTLFDKGHSHLILLILQDVIIYEASSDQEEALEYFYVDPTTGRVTIKKLLYPGSSTKEYSVSLFPTPA